MDFRNMFRSGLGLAGTALGGPLAGAAAGLAGGYLLGRGGGEKRKENDPRARYSAIASRLAGQAEQSPYETEGYQAEVAGARDAMREDAQSDAARAGTMGLSPGMATAAGSGQRARAIAGVQRGAVGRAGDRQTQLRQVAAQLAGNEVNMQMADEDRRDRRKANWMSTIGNLGTTAAGAYFDRNRNT